MRRSANALSSRTIESILVAVLSLLTRVAPADTPDPALAPASVDPLPTGWKAGQFDSDDLKTGSNSDLNAHFELTSEPKAANGNMSLADWAKLHQARDAKDSSLTHRHETDLQPAKRGEHDTLESEITGELYGMPLHYRVFFASVRGVYCELNCWVDAKNWEPAKGQFDQLAVNLK